MYLPDKMTPTELRASVGLAGIFGLRMLGMFLILPVFAIYAHGLPGGNNQTMVGLALGVYGLTQAMLQLPFGMASDRWGRKRVIYFGLLLFVIGSFVAAAADDIYMVIVGRAIQGAGAISAAVTALLADLTREEHRTKAMAMIGSTIGLAFAASMAFGPLLYQVIGVPGMFELTGVLALAAMGVVYAVVPDPHDSRFHSDAGIAPARLRDVLRDGQLLRLDFGIFALHAAQMAMFVVIPFALRETGGMPEAQHWKIYLPVMLGAFVFMVPPIIYSEKKAKHKSVFVFAVVLLLLSQLIMTTMMHSFEGIVAMLLLYFIAFNILEASLPSLISRVAPARAKGTAMGVYNTAQSLGLFVGGIVGGFLSHYVGSWAVFAFGGAISALWLVLAVSMKTPPAVRTRMFHIEPMTMEAARELSRRLIGLNGVMEAIVDPDEGAAILKVEMAGWDESGVNKLIKGDA